MHTLHDLENICPETDHPVLLFKENGHSIYWLGIAEKTAFRCNTYLIKDGDEALLIDPGGRDVFEEIMERLEGIVSIEDLAGIVLSHQDPDVAASMYDWLKIRPDIPVFATHRTHILLPHYGHSEYPGFDVEENDSFDFKSGNSLSFIPSPFLHFSGAVTSLDKASGYLFSGDVWAALDVDWRLVVKDFEYHTYKMDLFNQDYMASNRASRGFAESLQGHEIKAILPQHGSIIPERFVPDALLYLDNLQCGLDLIYPSDRFEAYLTEKDVSHDECFNHDNLHDNSLPLSGHELKGGSSSDMDYTDELGCKTYKDALKQAKRLENIINNAFNKLKMTELSLKKSEARLIEAQSIAHIGHWEWDIKTDKITWSDEIYRIFGLKPQSFEVIYHAFLERVHPEDREKTKEAMKKALSQDIPYDIIHRIIRSDGEIRVVHERARTDRNRDGEPVMMLGTVQDITELAETEEKLARKNRLIEAIHSMQTHFINNMDTARIHQHLLNCLLKLTESEHCFTGSVLNDPEGRPYLLIHALTDMSWDSKSRELYKKSLTKRLEFHDLDNLFGSVITSGEAVISNTPATDPRSRGVPEGHPELKNFLGIPVYFSDRVVGIIALANRDGGYDNEIVEYLSPLSMALGQIIVAKQDQAAKEVAEKILEEQARLDGLLGIPNRRYFDEYLEKQIQNAARNRNTLSIIMIDVDHFKLFNDLYGHQKGDKCLVEVARSIDESMRRPMDFVGRYGGEELCCILPETDLDGAIKVAEKIAANIKDRAMPHADSPVADRVTVSMGIAVWQPDAPVSPAELLAMADDCLYAAKRNGRNRIVSEIKRDRH